MASNRFPGFQQYAPIVRDPAIDFAAHVPLPSGLRIDAAREQALRPMAEWPFSVTAP